MSEASDLVSRVAEQVAARLPTEVYVALRYTPAAASTTGGIALWVYADPDRAKEGCQKNADLNRLGALTWSRNQHNGWSSQELTLTAGQCRYYVYPREVL